MSRQEVGFGIGVAGVGGVGVDRGVGVGRLCRLLVLLLGSVGSVVVLGWVVVLLLLVVVVVLDFGGGGHKYC